MYIDQRLLKLVKDKTVAYVCPGQHLLGSKLGEKIDSYDIVIRVNQKFEIPEERKIDYGTRTDIIFSAFNDRCINECKRNWSFFKNCKDLKMAAVTQLPDGPSTGFKEYFERELGIPYFIPNRQELLDEIFTPVGTNCNTGLIGAIMLQMCGAKKIFVAGSNFYNFGKYGSVYYNEYYDSLSYGKGYDKQFAHNNNRVVTAQNCRWDIHNMHKQILYFKNLVEKYKDVFELDSYLAKNLSKYNTFIVGMLQVNKETDIAFAKSAIEIMKINGTFDKIVINGEDSVFLDAIVKHPKIITYQRRRGLSNDEIILDFINNTDYSHLIRILPVNPFMSTQELKLFSNYMLAYDLNILYSISNNGKKQIGFTDRIKPTTDDATSDIRKFARIKIDDISSKPIVGYQTKRLKELRKQNVDYLEDDKLDSFIMDNMDPRGIYLPLLEAIKIDLA